MATVKDAKRVSGGVEYRGKKYPGFNKPMQYRGSGNYKQTVLAKKGDKIKVVNFGHKGYGHNYSSEARKSYLARSAGIRNKSGLPRTINSRQTTGQEKFYGLEKERPKNLHLKNDFIY